MSCGGVSHHPAHTAYAKPSKTGTDDLEKRYDDMQRRQVEMGLKTAEMNAKSTEIGELLSSISEAARVKA